MPLTRRHLLAATTAGALFAATTACSASPGGPAAATTYPTGPATITFWGAAAGLDKIVERYNSIQQDITVRFSAVTGGNYQKLESAVKSNTGPDLAQVEFYAIPTLAVSGVLKDVSALAKQYASHYTESAWADAGFLDQHYGIPNDRGPLVSFVNRKALDAVGIKNLATWTEYREAAQRYKASTGGYLGTLFTAGAFLAAVVHQNGAKWFDIDGDKWVVRMTDPASIQALDLWFGMAKEGLVNVDPGFNAGYWQMLDSGKIASYTVGAWGYRGMKGNLRASAGSWQVAPVPQWDAAKPRNSTWGGSTWSVTANSTRPDAALKFAHWLASDPEAMNLQYQNSGYYPATGKTASITGFDAPDAFFGGQAIGPVFNSAAAQVGTDWKWGPSISTVFSLLEDRIAQAVSTGSSAQMLGEVQQELVSRMKSSGLQVSQG